MMRQIFLSFLLSFSGLNAIQEKTGDVNEFLNKCILAIQKQDYDQALIYIHRAKKIDSHDVEVYRLEAQLQEILGNKDDAITAWENCLNLSESDTLTKEAEIHLDHLRD